MIKERYNEGSEECKITRLWLLQWMVVQELRGEWKLSAKTDNERNRS